MQNRWRGKELIKFCPPNCSDDLCLFFCIYPSCMVYLCHSPRQWCYGRSSGTGPTWWWRASCHCRRSRSPPIHTHRYCKQICLGNLHWLGVVYTVHCTVYCMSINMYSPDRKTFMFKTYTKNTVFVQYVLCSGCVFLIKLLFLVQYRPDEIFSRFPIDTVNLYCIYITV